VVQINLFSHTFDSYVQAVYSCLKKGREHAGIFYQQWIRTGTVCYDHPAFRNAQQLLKDILQITDLTHPTIDEKMTDGETTKFLSITSDALKMESVLISMRAGNTLCISSQVGCQRGCAFCETGKMGLIRNLTPNEMVGQLFLAHHQLQQPVRNVVFMGMGEPFDNEEAVMRAVEIFSDPYGFGLGSNHITISTSGHIEGIQRLINRYPCNCNLAVSLNASNDSLRNRLMPINRKYNMQMLYDAINNYCTVTGRQVLVAYVLIKDLNDTVAHADELANYLQGLQVKVNLIPYNSQRKDRFQTPENKQVHAFRDRLHHQGYRTLLRQTKGQKIMAACGQLGNRASIIH